MEELLMAAEYILSHGNYDVMLCERGIRTFETYTRNTLDINAVPVLKELSHLPVIVDPQPRHGQGRVRDRDCAGCGGRRRRWTDHRSASRPGKQAVSDGAQTLTPARYCELVAQVRRVAGAVDRAM